MTAMRRPTLHMIDPIMVNEAGHHYFLAREMRRGAMARGWNVRLYVPRSADRDSIVSPLHAVPCLDHVPTLQVFPMPEADIGAVNYRFRLALNEVAAAVGPEDVVFLPIANHRTLFGLTDWVEDRERPPFARLALVPAVSECFADHEGTIHQRNSRIYRTLCRRLAERLGGAVTLLAYSSFYARHLSELIGRSVPVDPFPFSFQRPAGPVPPPSLPPMVGLLGATGWEQKGLKQFLEAMALLQREQAGCRFLVQIDETFERTPLRPRLGEALAALERDGVTVLSGALPETAYDRSLADCGLVVLPYGPAYRRQSSGLLYEALTRGRPVVVPAKSELSATITSLGITMPQFHDWTGEAVADAIRHGLGEFHRFREQAEQAAVRIADWPDAVLELLDRIGVDTKALH